MAKRRDHSQVDERAISIVVNLLTRWGLSYRDSLVYAYLLLSPKEELNMNELSELTGLSPSSISYSLKHLKDRYFVELSRKDGRTKYYVAKPMFYRNFIKQPMELLNAMVLPLMVRLREIRDETDDARYSERLDEILDELSKLKCILEKIIEIEQSEACS
ncbi:MAG: ArsR family transcriptional regulator [Desulfurococcales archaeon]|nr:ArsR family transcriptional regulator [Desulfurococcales archaeon]